MSLKKPGLWFGLITLGALALNLWLRLTPFDFVWDGRVPWERLSLAPLTLRDVPLNVLLFVPLGFGLAGIVRNRRLRRFRRFFLICEICVICGFLLLLSVMLEAAQLFMPARAPSVADVVANGLGALLGVGLYRVWTMGIGTALRRYATRRNLIQGLYIYAVFVMLLTDYLQYSAGLSNWDDAFPLVIGNEAVGQRQWSGRVKELSITAEKLGYKGYFPLSGAAPFEDELQSLGLPPLVWREGPVTPQDGEGVVVGPGEWLATEGSFAPISSRARQTNYFVIQVRVTTAARDQRGPARIVSISADAERRNVTLGQMGDKLVIRLRTPAAGENGQKPEILVPGVFTDIEPRHIWVIYDAPLLHVSVDKEPYESDTYRLSLAPGLAFFPGFANENRWPVVMDGNPYRYDWAYWGLVAGLAVLLFGGLFVARWVAVRKEERSAD